MQRSNERKSWTLEKTSQKRQPSISFLSILCLLLVIACIVIHPVNSYVLQCRRNSLSRKCAHEIGCRGQIDMSMYAKLDRICVDCHNLFHEPTIEVQCRMNCFTGEYFEACVQVLLQKDSMEDFDAMRTSLRKH